MSHRETIRVENGNISYSVSGSGPVTVVLEAGLGDGMNTWDRVFNELSMHAGVFAYSRPGYEGSSATTRPRDAAHVVADLRHLLRKTGTKPPYVLVGHSLGGNYMTYFAQRYPLEVAALVLVDARHPNFTRLCKTRNIRGCGVPSLVYTLWPEHVRREYDAAQDMKLSGSIGDMPLAVVSRAPGPGALESERFAELWADTQKELAQSSTNSKQFVSKRAGHYVQKDDPEMVVGGVLWAISQSGRHGSKSTLTN